MLKYKTLVIALIAAAWMAATAFCQESASNRQMTIISGTLAEVDFAGGTIIVKTDSGQVEIAVPDDAMITGGTEKLGLADLEDNDPVTVRYYSSPSGQNVAAGIVDNNATFE
jgi:hypothetical protein